MVRQYAERDAAATRRTVRFCAPQAGHVALDPGALVEYTNLLAACGLLPRSLGRVAVEIDVHRPIQQMGTGELTAPARVVARLEGVLNALESGVLNALAPMTGQRREVGDTRSRRDVGFGRASVPPGR
jgi:hypothetical protein